MNTGNKKVKGRFAQKGKPPYLHSSFRLLTSMDLPAPKAQKQAKKKGPRRTWGVLIPRRTATGPPPGLPNPWTNGTFKVCPGLPNPWDGPCQQPRWDLPPGIYPELGIAIAINDPLPQFLL